MKFSKYQGTGNDFVLIDNRDAIYQLSTKDIAHLCHRRLGIGADGLMLLEHADGYDFRMVYYNADGNESTMCGNGGRCITAFAHKLGIITDRAHFVAIDGPHHATLDADGTVHLHMQDVPNITPEEGYTVLNTGSPHHVQWVKDVQEVDVAGLGRSIRHHERYAPGGTNVNFAMVKDGQLSVRTYERGVEDETLSCGTGVTAAAIASTCTSTGTYILPVNTPGGKLSVSFFKDTPSSARNVILSGPAILVFEGEIAW